MQKLISFVILLSSIHFLLSNASKLKQKSTNKSLITEKKEDSRILGPLATPVSDINEYPWIASIQIGTNPEVTGTIVGKYWVLTFASEGKRLSDIIPLGAPVRVVYGSLDISAAGSATQKFRKVKATGYKLYPQYDQATNAYPFILIRVCPGFDPAQPFATLGLDNNPSLEGMTGKALGWFGHSSDEGSAFVIDGRVVGMVKYTSCGNPPKDTFTELSSDVINWITNEVA